MAISNPAFAIRKLAYANRNNCLSLRHFSFASGAHIAKAADLAFARVGGAVKD
jgi:hypothetical protein